MADKKTNDKEDEQGDQQSQASKETTSSSDPVPVEEDPVAVEECPVNEAPETDQQPVRNRRSTSPTGEEVEPEGKRPKYAGSSSDSNLPDPNSPPNQENTSALSKSPALAHTPAVSSMTDLIVKQLIPVIESWLHAHIRNSPPGTTLSIPGVASPPRPLRPPKPPRPPGSKPVASSAQQQRMQQALPPGGRLLSYHDVINGLRKHESELNSLKADLDEMRSDLSQVTDDLLIEVEKCQLQVRKLAAEVQKLKGGSDDLQADLADSYLEAEVINLQGSNDGLQAELVDYKLKGKVEESSEGEIADDDSSCSTGGRIRRIPSVDAEMLSAMLLRRIKSGPGSTSRKANKFKKPATKAAGDGLSKKGKNKAIIETDKSQDEMKVDYYTSQDEMKVDNASQDETKDDYTSKDEMEVDNTSQDEMKDDITFQDENSK